MFEDRCIHPQHISHLLQIAKIDPQTLSVDIDGPDCRDVRTEYDSWEVGYMEGHLFGEGGYNWIDDPEKKRWKVKIELEVFSKDSPALILQALGAGK